MLLPARIVTWRFSSLTLSKLVPSYNNCGHLCQRSAAHQAWHSQTQCMACAAGMEYQCQCGEGKMTDPANRFKCIEAVSFAWHPCLRHPKRSSRWPC